MPIDQANGLTDLLVRAPLAGFLALTLLALLGMFVLYVREKAAHMATLEKVVTLTTAISGQWNLWLAQIKELIEQNEGDARFQQALKFVLERVVEKLESRSRKTTASHPVATARGGDFAPGLEPISKVTVLPPEVRAALKPKEPADE